MAASSSARGSRSSRPAAPIKQLSIENPLGDVRVEGHDGTSIQIETRKHAPDDEALDRLRVSLVPEPRRHGARSRPPPTAARRSRPLARGAVRDRSDRSARRATRASRRPSARGTLEVLNMDAGGELDTALRADHRCATSPGELSTHSVSGATSLDAGVRLGRRADAVVGCRSRHDRRRAARRVGEPRQDRRPPRARARRRADDDERQRSCSRPRPRCAAASWSSSLHGDVDVQLRRARRGRSSAARGTKVDLGAAPARTQPDGWIEAHARAAGERAAGDRRAALARTATSSSRSSSSAAVAGPGEAR